MVLEFRVELKLEVPTVIAPAFIAFKPALLVAVLFAVISALFFIVFVPDTSIPRVAVILEFIALEETLIAP